METGAYFFARTMDLAYPEAVAKTRKALADQGFGVLSEIDVQAKLREKLGVDFQPYLILGACNPPLAHQALQEEPNLGTLLPCNVVVYTDAEGRTRVAAMDPERVMQVVDNPRMHEIAGRVRALLVQALESL